MPQRFGEPLENSILLITDNEKVSKLVKAKVLLLRNSDVFESVSSKDCLEKVKEKNPVLIFYHLCADNEEEFLNFVQKIRQNDNTKTCSVILLFEEFDENVVAILFTENILYQNKSHCERNFVMEKNTKTILWYCKSLTF